MSTAPYFPRTASFSGSLFSPIDALLLCLWGAMALVCTAVKVSPFLTLAVYGGLVLIARHFYCTVWLGQRAEADLAIAAFMPYGFVLLAAALSQEVHLTPILYDRQLAALDHGVAIAVRQWALSTWWAYKPTCAVYLGLPLAIVLAIASTKGRDRQRLLAGLVIGGVLVTPLYLLFPAVGPAHIGELNAPRNCMPSMHLTWALLIWANMRGRARYAAAAFAALTALATLVTGEHYLPDLIAALPWTWLIAFLAKRAIR